MVRTDVVHPSIKLSSITVAFKDAVSALRQGSLVKDDHFALFEAVSALEIGDPKMDSGCTSIHSAVDIGANIVQPNSPEEVIWLMDQLLYRETSWHMGYPLSQTLFTSIHLDLLLWPQPSQLSDSCFERHSQQLSNSPLLQEVLRPFCLSLVKCCDLVLTMVTSQHYYEEEDFATQVFNRPLLHEFSTEEILNLLYHSEIWISDSDIPDAFKAALRDRLSLRARFLEMLFLCASKEPPRPKLIESILALTSQTEATSSLGRSPSSQLFTLKIQRKLASSVPPRPMVVAESHEAFDFMRNLVNDAASAFQMFEIRNSSDLLLAYRTFMSQTPQPAVYVRALLQSFLTCQNGILGKFTTQDAIFQELRYLVLPASSILDAVKEFNDASHEKGSQVSDHLKLFANRLSQSYLNLFRTYCLNRCRVRRTLCHAALEWDQLQTEAEDLDSTIQSISGEQPISYPPGESPAYSYSLSSWIYHHKMVQLGNITQLGFELSIYATHELADMYWYLAFLSGTHIAHLERINFFIASRQNSRSQQIVAKQDEEIQLTTHILFRNFSLLKAIEAFAKSLHRVYVLLQRHGHLVKPPYTYSPDRLRYELRMRPFQYLSVPEPISVEEAYTSCRMMDTSDQALLEQASRLNASAKKGWEEILKQGWNAHPLSLASRQATVDTETVVEREWKQHIKNILRASIANSITISTLSNVIQSNFTVQNSRGIKDLEVFVPEVGNRERWHASWPVPILK